MKKSKYQGGAGLKEMVSDGPAYSKNPDLSKLISNFKTPKGAKLKKIAIFGAGPNGKNSHPSRSKVMPHKRRGAVD